MAALTLAHPDQEIFQCGISVAPIVSWKLYGILSILCFFEFLIFSALKIEVNYINSIELLFLYLDRFSVCRKIHGLSKCCIKLQRLRRVGCV